ncbi:peptidoglycan O-acetyltransferase [bacterium BMS3Bbin10]|nr:peptidoglycan O-acetyltransferase [bacterium BMS3Bbin10]
MLFNSQLFLLLFLPVTLIAYYAFAGSRARREWLLIAASLIFYGYWDYRLVPLLVGSIAANWILAHAFRAANARLVLVLGVALNLSLIGVFKYADFFAGSLAWVLGAQHSPWNIILPLGISFFTFQQISYLADRYRGEAPVYGFREYFLYVSFFPQLIAGPIVRHNELIFQLELPPLRKGLYERLSRGATLLAIGLVKKVFIADTAARIADPLFASAGAAALSMIDAWVATAAFTFQIYFDFSGYSDMAIGLALMFGLTLPVNFNVPYRAASIREFWRRWHITLSHFLRDYLYIPFGGRRHGKLMQSAALTLTMFLGGLWHGAGWTFVVWGLMHGLGLAVHAWWSRLSGIVLPEWAGWALTMVFVMTGWVLFRAPDFPTAMSILASMFGGNGFAGAASAYGAHPAILVLAAGVALIGPSSQAAALERGYDRPWVAFAVASALTLSVIMVGSRLHSEFIYFQF